MDTKVVTSYALYMLIGFICYITMSYNFFMSSFYLFILLICIMSCNNFYKDKKQLLKSHNIQVKKI